MPKLNIIIYKCDICCEESKRNEDVSTWLDFEIDGQEERTWINKSICPRCLNKIKEHEKYRKI